MFRNKEFKYAAIIFFVISAVVVRLEFKISTLAGIIAFGGTVIIGILFFVFTRARYKRIAELSYDIDNVLNNDEHLYILDQEASSFGIYKCMWAGGADNITFSFPWESTFISMVTVLFVVFITMLYSISKIKKENIIDVLRDDMD